MTALIVLAKAPRPGHVKTRLCPPCTPAQAAGLAAAALQDTLAAVAATPASRRVLVLAGEPGPWLTHDVEVLPQRGGGLAERLAAAFHDVGGPALLVGMDTPQLTAPTLAAGMAALEEHDAVLGPTLDGGYWSIGLRRADARVFDGVPMSVATTCAAQRARLVALGLHHADLPPLRDVDHFADALDVAARPGAVGTRFAREVDRVSGQLTGARGGR